MNFDISDKLASIQNIFKHISIINGVIFSIAILFFWFLPAIIAMFVNPKHFKKILIACVPAGLSFIAWGGLMVWAISGKLQKNSATEDSIKK